MARSLKALAQEAIDIQNACNIRGVSKSFAEVVDEVHELLAFEAMVGSGIPARYPHTRFHPVVKLWASKIHDLTCMGLSDMDAYHEAYEACKAMAAGDVVPTMAAVTEEQAA